MAPHKLVITTDVRPLLTVEMVQKWYTLFLVGSGDAVEEIDFGHLEEHTFGDTSPYVDHVPNPTVVEAMAHQNDWTIDPMALELLYGRWAIEVEGKTDE